MALSPEFMQDLWVRRILSTTGHTLLVYDYLLTLKDEAYYIWNRPWTVVKVLFLINRYGNLIGQTFIQLEEAGLLSHGSQVFCHRFTLSTSCFMFLSTESIHIIVLMRTWAIWGTQKRVANVLTWSYVFYILVLTGAGAYNATTKSTQFLQLDVTNICFTTISNYVWLLCFGSFILDTLLFVLTMRSLWIYSKGFKSLYHSDLLYILVRDTIIFFTVSMLSNALRMTALTAYAGNPKNFIAKAFGTPLLSVAGQRLVLNLQDLEWRTYTPQDLSREVDRQLEVFAAADPPSWDDMDHPESGQTYESI